jgi:hypothetical protein
MSYQEAAAQIRRVGTEFREQLATETDPDRRQDLADRAAHAALPKLLARQPDEEGDHAWRRTVDQAAPGLRTALYDAVDRKTELRHLHTDKLHPAAASLAAALMVEKTVGDVEARLATAGGQGR